MGTPIVESATYPSTVVAPAAGDPVTAASVAVGEQSLANRTAWLLSKGYGGTAVSGQHISPAGLSYGLVSRSVTRVQQGIWTASDGTVVTPTSAIFYNTGGIFPLGVHGEMAIMVPHGATITGVKVYLSPQPHAALPGVMPKIGLFKWVLSTATRTFIDEQVDTSTPVATYNARHAITLTLGTPELVDRTDNWYFVRFTNEQGANSNLITPPAVIVTYTTSAIDDGY